MTYYILLTWWILPINKPADYPSPSPRPAMGVYATEQSACVSAKNLMTENSRLRTRIYRFTVTHKACTSVPDPEFISCLVKEGEFEVKDGSCEPRQEFIFEEKP